MIRSVLSRQVQGLASLAGYHIFRLLPVGVDFLADIARLADPNSITLFFDVGANTGQTSHAALARFRQAHVIAFEPNPTSCKKIPADLRLSIHNLALGSKPGTKKLFCNAPTRDSFVFADDGSATIEVDCDTIDNFCNREAINRIDVLKIDTEGYDLEVLRGAKQMLSVTRFVYTEFFDFEEPYPGAPSLTDILQFLRPLGFRFIATYTESVTDDRTCSNILLQRFQTCPRDLPAKRW